MERFILVHKFPFMLGPDSTLYQQRGTPTKCKREAINYLAAKLLTLYLYRRIDHWLYSVTQMVINKWLLSLLVDELWVQGSGKAPAHLNTDYLGISTPRWLAQSRPAFAGHSASESQICLVHTKCYCEFLLFYSLWQIDADAITS